ncbi:MAG: sulfatase-like hydrolase/transferase [Opitutae bacterium]|nr:sulfatase-like hydrolase/transferase [Opitutae bacterium]
MYKRKLLSFILSIGIGILSLVQAEKKLPNILWLTSEDNGPHLGCYGDSYATTPNIDNLAARGMIYTRAISNAPVCAPARTTIISGMYPPSTGSEHMRSMTSLPSGFKMYPTYLRELGYYCTNNSKEDYNLRKVGEVWHESGRKGHWRNRKKDQPFFAIFNFTVSHESQIRKRPHNAVHDPAKVRIPAYHPDHPAVRQDWAQYYDKMTEMDKQVGAKLKELEDDGLAEDTIVFYYGDHGSGMPRSKRWPFFSGLNVPLVVHVPKKWKEVAPDGNKLVGFSDRRVGFVDLAPTVLSIAGMKPPAHMQGHAFMGKHAAPAQDYSYGFRGRMDERYDMVRSVVGERYIYIRNYMPHKLYGQHVNYMFITPTTQIWRKLFDEGKLNEAQSHFWKTKPAEELYDLQEDPDEVKNLAKSDEHKDILNRMRKAHRAHTASIRDVGFLPEGEIHERSKDSTPYEMGHDDKKYPFEAIRSAAELASGMRKQDLGAITKLLDSKESAVRYWGAMGLLMQNESGVRHGRKKLLAALKDSSPYVRVIAAEALGKHGSKGNIKLAVKTLGTLADPIVNGCFPSMLAMNAIDHLDEKARPVLPTIQKMPITPNEVDGRFKGYVGRLVQTTLAELGATRADGDKPSKPKRKKK